MRRLGLGRNPSLSRTASSSHWPPTWTDISSFVALQLLTLRWLNVWDRATRGARSTSSRSAAARVRRSSSVPRMPMSQSDARPLSAFSRIWHRIGRCAKHWIGEWHFIPAIDIDGFALNEGWFRGERTLELYLENFHRPPFRRQPEYAFPLDAPGYRFDEQTPESSCWRLAIDRIRPQLQCSLHGADTGGSFFLLSDCRPGLCKSLANLPARAGITFNTVGDASAETTELAPGIFSFPNIDAQIATAIASHQAPGDVWNASATPAPAIPPSALAHSTWCARFLFGKMRVSEIPATADGPLARSSPTKFG